MRYLIIFLIACGGPLPSQDAGYVDPHVSSTPLLFTHCYDNEIGVKINNLQCTKVNDRSYWLPSL